MRHGLAFISLCLLLTSCMPLRGIIHTAIGCSDEERARLNSLEIPASFFPSTAQYNPIHSLREPHPARCGVMTTHYWTHTNRGNGSAIFFAEQHGESEIAKYGLKFGEKYQNASTRVDTKLNADEFYTSCGEDVTNSFRCVYTGRYDKLNVFLHVHIDQKSMTQDMFFEAVQWLDQQASSN